ncbi:callose synthase 9-like [Rutidosis leptorrhynchoides]|uniref:callose synthase 9-like n=1 Tax=Rutidosis leptorrhynchoides TaxID=125765 RepID=UPI003A99DE21
MSDVGHRDAEPGGQWERLVRAALGRERTGIAGNVPSSLLNSMNIESILQAADEIQDEDPNISRILCEHAHTLAQNLDPNSEGRGVIQFKTGLNFVIKQKLAKKDGAGFDRSQYIARLREFYMHYREKNNVDKLREEEMELRGSGTLIGNYQELERKTVKRERVYATLNVLGTVLEHLIKEVSPEEAEGLIPEELKKVIESDAAAMTEEDMIALNIIPLEVRAAISSLKYFRGLPKLPESFPIPATRSADIFDFLHFTFGFQKGNVSNQRENIVNLLSNEQSRLGVPNEHEPKLDETTVDRVFLKSLDNYIKWCKYLGIPPMWINTDVNKEEKVLFISLYFLIRGEAANIRYLPECICYIFHRMGEELDDLLRQQLAKPADSCVTKNGVTLTGVSFLEQVV